MNKIEVEITKEVQEGLKDINIDVDQEVMTAIKNAIGDDVKVNINIKEKNSV